MPIEIPIMHVYEIARPRVNRLDPTSPRRGRPQPMPADQDKTSDDQKLTPEEENEVMALFG